VLAAGGLVLAHRVAALLEHAPEHGDHLRVVELDALVHFLLLDGGVDQADHAQAVLVAGLHRGLHVCGQGLLEGHGGFSGGSVGSWTGNEEKPATRGVAGFSWKLCEAPRAGGAAGQYRRWRLVTSRAARRAWRFTAAAALRLRSWVGFS